MIGVCFLCPKEKELHYRFKGNLICRACYKSKIRPVSARREGMAVCSACHKRNKSKKNVFIRTFLELSDVDAALLLTREMRQGRKIFARQVGFLLKSDETKNKLIEVLKIMLQIPSGWKIIEKIISGRNCVKFKEFLQSLY